MQRKLIRTLIASSSCCVLTSFANADHLSGNFDLGQSAAILTESAIPMAKGKWYANLSTEILENQSFSDDKLIGLRTFDIQQHGEAHSDLHSVEQISSTSVAFAYGVTDNFSLGMRIPYIKRENIREPETGHAHGGAIILHNVIEHGDSKGLGDATLMGLYRFQQTENANFALLFGLKFPTGDEDESGFKGETFVRRIDTGVLPDAHGHDEGSGHSHVGNLLETHQQPGSGSYDPILGFAYSRKLGIFDLNSSVLYSFVNEGSQTTNLGDSFKYNLGLTYSPSNNLQLVAELNGQWQEQEVRGDEVISNSGARILYFAPGVRYRIGNNWSAALSYGMPIKETTHGYQSEPKSRVSGNLSFNF